MPGGAVLLLECVRLVEVVMITVVIVTMRSGLGVQPRGYGRTRGEERSACSMQQTAQHAATLYQGPEAEAEGGVRGGDLRD